MGLLDQLEDILGSDPLIDEVGFIHPSQFAALNEEGGGSLPSSAETILQSGDVVPRLRVSELNSSETGFWCRDHKLGISTQVLLPLYNAAKQVFIAALERYKMYSSIPTMKDESGGNGMSNCFPSSLGILENEVMKHSRALLLLSCDFRTAWNSRKRILSSKQHLQIFVDELFLSALVLSYAPKSECSWSHRRWVIKTIAGKCSNLQEIVDRESELVKKIAEKSKMNYRAWNHGCWLVSYMSRGQVLQELNKSRDWTGLHIADSSCFHYRSRLILRMLEELWYELNPTLASGYCSELRQVWKEELDWNEMLIKRYIGREALWLHRRFLSLGWIKHFATTVHDHKDTKSHEIGMFIDNELGLIRSCLVIPDDDFEDFQAHAIFSSTYILWLTKQISENPQIEFQEDLLVGELKPVISKLCPEKTFLLYSFRGTNGDL